MERVTVQYNGEQVTLDVPDGMPDDQIIAYLQQQTQQQSQQQITQMPASVAQPIQQQATLTAVKPAVQIAGSQLDDAIKLAKIAGQVTPKIAGEFLSTPIKSAKDIFSAYVAGHPLAAQVGNMPLKAMPKAALTSLGAAAMAPENLLAAPYTMAAYEQEKIRQNPTAPQYEFNPYAQMVRGQAATQGQAGARNTAQARQQMPTGPITPDQAQAILESGSARDIAAFGGQDRLTEMIRRKAAERVLGPVQP